ncbi:unnamed protein product [Acanthoscelides obtectus]|uniref:Uncharacterized protein n=1 Tax=Acanthoscelides obtectus TaxID=200917 RepID=A0A9P0Q625_ACAOB|nr:unnamed protein product [Acanthoscelides obtectus]CAK1632416.1 Zinc finger protein 391 [Acanthoscelides obtectus]
MILTALNLSKICRICLEEREKMYCIYSDIPSDIPSEKNPKIFEVLLKISSIKVEPCDGFPSMICSSCLEKTNISYSFQRQCNASQCLLETYTEHMSSPKHNVFSRYKTLGSTTAGCSNTASELNFVDKNSNSTSTETAPESSSTLAENNEIEALKSYLPFSDDTVDQFIKENFLENVDITLKLKSFNKDLFNKNKMGDSQTKTKEYAEQSEQHMGKGEDNEQQGKEGSGDGDESTMVLQRTMRDVPNMDYYKKYNDNDTSYVYECNICLKTFHFSSNLRIHLNEHIEDKPFMCSYCKKGFKIYSSLVHHSKSHSAEHPFECTDCGKKYKQSPNLTAHLRAHTGSKPYTCATCGKGFKQPQDLAYHVKIHTKEKKHVCNTCGKTMSMYCHLVQHMRCHVGDKVFKCVDCEKDFSTIPLTSKATATSGDVKPFKCDQCGKSFNRSSSLRVHSKTHSDERKHTCRKCGKGFTWMHSLRAHLVVHEKEELKEVNKESELVPPPPLFEDTQSVPEPSQSTSEPDSSDMEMSAKELETESLTIYSASDPDDFQIYSVASSEEKMDTLTLFPAEPSAEEELANLKKVLQMSRDMDRP